MTQGSPGGYNPPPGGYGGPPPGAPPGGHGGPPGGYGGPPGGYGAPPGGFGGPPPGGYGAPPRGYGGPPAPSGGFPPGGPLAPGGFGGLNLAAFNQREPVRALLLTIVTCGIYGLVWKYQTTDELRQASGDASINPGLDLALTILLCGLWAVYTDYRNAKKVHELARAAGLQRADQSTVVVVLDLCGLALASAFLLQGEYNALGQAAQGRQLPR